MRDIYRDIADRTDGNIYIGVVGPVRTGKSTFVKRFMEDIVLPNIPKGNKQRRSIDELPQSADGKTIMTTQPRFVPEEAVRVQLGDNATASVRLVDSVGYMVDGALGDNEDGVERKVRTPWADGEIPFSQAAEIGTRKVLTDYSTVAIMITTDGSITGISREKYIPAEQKIIAEMQASGKPYVIILNTTSPTSATTTKLANSMSDKYNAPVLCINVLNIGKTDFANIVDKLLGQFPMRSIAIDTPRWMQVLDNDNYIIGELRDCVKALCIEQHKMSDCTNCDSVFASSSNVTATGVSLDMATGQVVVKVEPKDGVYYRVLSEQCGTEVEDDYKLMAYVKRLHSAERQYAKIKDAMDEVESTGYGIVVPTMEEMQLEDPEVVKKGSQYGVKLKASAPSLHIMKVDVETEVCPVVGTEQQGEDMIKYLMGEFEGDKKDIWDTNLFGKPLSSLVKEGINVKLFTMPQDVRGKLRKTVGKIVNDGRGGVVCILL